MWKSALQLGIRKERQTSKKNWGNSHKVWSTKLQVNENVLNKRMVSFSLHPSPPLNLVKLILFSYANFMSY